MKKAGAFCDTQEKWIRNQVKNNRQDPYWRQVRIFVSQWISAVIFINYGNE